MGQTLIIEKKQKQKEEEEDYGFSTYNYEEFAFIKSNREKYGRKAWRELVASIRKKGYMITPATVNTLKNLGIKEDNDRLGLWDEHGRWNKWDKPFPPKYVVIDGQHRLIACKLENLSYKVYVNNDAQLIDIVECNVIQSKWSALQFARYHHTHQNHPEATSLYKYMVNWNGIYKINTIHKVLNGPVNNIRVDFNPKINIDHSAINVLAQVHTLKDILPKNDYKHEKLVFAFQEIYKRFPNFKMNWFSEGLRVSSYGEHKGINLEISTKMEFNIERIKEIYYIGQEFSEKTKITPEDYLPIDSTYFNERQKQIIKQRAKHSCEYCGAKEQHGAKLEIDHYIAVEKGGKTEIGNGVSSCTDCNGTKSDTLVENKTSFLKR